MGNQSTSANNGLRTEKINKTLMRGEKKDAETMKMLGSDGEEVILHSDEEVDVQDPMESDHEENEAQDEDLVDYSEDNVVSELPEKTPARTNVKKPNVTPRTSARSKYSKKEIGEGSRRVTKRKPSIPKFELSAVKTEKNKSRTVEEELREDASRRSEAKKLLEIIVKTTGENLTPTERGACISHLMEHPDEAGEILTFLKGYRAHTYDYARELEQGMKTFLDHNLAFKAQISDLRGLNEEMKLDHLVVVYMMNGIAARIQELLDMEKPQEYKPAKKSRQVVEVPKTRKKKPHIKEEKIFIEEMEDIASVSENEESPPQKSKAIRITENTVGKPSTKDDLKLKEKLEDEETEDIKPKHNVKQEVNVFISHDDLIKICCMLEVPMKEKAIRRINLNKLVKKLNKLGFYDMDTLREVTKDQKGTVKRIKTAIMNSTGY